MIQNYILLFLRKSLIAYPFLLGALFLIVPQASFSAAIETTGYTIDPFPLQPVESGSLDIVFTETAVCDFVGIHLNKTKIDSINKQIKISMSFGIFSAGTGCAAHNEIFQVQVIDNLPSSGKYQILVYDEDSRATAFFENQKLIGSFDLTISPAISTSIPTLSEWMLILLAGILLFIATNKIQLNNRENK